MKKALGVFCLILIAVYAALSLAGTTSPYMAEMRFWKARSVAQQVVANPEATPPLLFKRARENFERIIKDYADKPGLVKEAQLSIGGLFIYEKKFGEARDFLRKTMEEHVKDKAFQARAQFLIGFSYERADSWAEALKEYRVMMDRYPQSQVGLQVPLYIARHDIQQDTEKGAESYAAAAAHYRRLIQTTPKGPLGYLTMTYLLAGYEEEKEWEKALEVMKEMVLTYPTVLRVHFPKIEAFSKRIKDPEKAILIYEAFIQAHPDSKDVSILKRRIAQFRKGN